MKITRFKIKELHGIFDYDVRLNEDLTFIYGENGSGKTTVLNMLDSVVSGEVYKLFNYSFKEVIVYYEKRKNGVKSLVKVESKGDYAERRLIIDFDGESMDIYRNQVSVKEGELDERRVISNLKFFSKFKLAKKIRKTFNYVFLPLNRLSYEKYIYDYTSARINRSKLIHEDFIFDNSIENMSRVKALVYRSISIINSDINELNDKFRETILKSALEVEADINITDLFKYFGSNNVIDELEVTKNKYIKLLKELKTITTKEQKQDHIKYFDNLIKKVEKSLKNISDSNGRLPADLLGAYIELIRISKLIKLHEKMNRSIEELKLPINKFLEYTNLFLNNAKDKKKLVVTPHGHLSFTTNYTGKEVSLEYLSSGEKQIVTLFANLIFKVKRDNFTIFIVDEPELSLHLSWQNKLVETIRKINDNMQIVFATHSPEIIGKYDEKVFELQKMYKPVVREAENVVKKRDNLEDLVLSKLLKDLEDLEYELLNTRGKDD